MAPQAVFDQKRRQIAEAASLVKGTTFEIIHHAAWQGDIDAFGTGGIGDFTTARNRSGGVEPLLQLLHQILEQ